MGDKVKMQINISAEAAAALNECCDKRKRGDLISALLLSYAASMPILEAAGFPEGQVSRRIREMGRESKGS